MEFLLLLVLLVTACSSEYSNLQSRNVSEIREVLLTPPEAGTLKLTTLSQEDLNSLSMTEFPGYIDPATISGLVGLYSTATHLESVYISGYKRNDTYEKEGSDIGVHTLRFNSDDLSPILDNFILHSIYQRNRYIFLHKDNVLVVLWADEESDLPLISEIAGKLSQRIGMVIVDPNNPPPYTVEKCGFQERFNCIKHSINPDNIVLWLENDARTDVIIRNLTVRSNSLKGGDCTTGIINKFLPRGENTAFKLETGSTPFSCYYQDLDKEKNLYRITVDYKVMNGSEDADKGGSEYTVLKGAILAVPPS